MRILLAEDETDLSRALVAILSHSGYETDAVYDGEAAVEKASSAPYDCMIFDIMMPKMDGIEALKILRSRGNVTPVIMLTAKAEIDDRITGLDAGADDYLTKPFAMGELLARIRSLTRRSESYTPKQLSVGGVTLNTDEQELSSHNSIRLAGKETKMMEFFMLNAGKELTTQELLDHIWSDSAEKDPEIVWVYVSYLRNKLQAIQADIEITGERGGSYRLQTHDREKAI
ncbi:MAG: response regulator transcription factor [Bilifractor sp.]